MIVLLGLFLVSVEMSARLDDWLYRDVPFLATPDHDRDLFSWYGGGKRGRPHGHYKKWRLNEFGFRGPEIQRSPAAEQTRIVILGASETFGLCESEDKEFPAQLSQLLGRSGRYEVVNAALPGLTVRSMIPYWEDWVAQFRPDIVFIYPSPLFYLSKSWPQHKLPRTPRTQAASTQEPSAEKPLPLQLRLISHMKNVFHVPDFIQKRRDQRKIDSETADKSADWFFRTVPQDRLEFFADDLATLTESIRKSGARPILVTHAMRCTVPPQLDDQDYLHSMRVHIPRASEEVMPEFEDAANRTIVELGAKHEVLVVDAAGAMNGRRHLFADLVHFTDEGASVLAELLAERTRTIPPPGNAVRAASR